MSDVNPHFATTQWTLVWEAAKEDSSHGRPALAEIVRRYWQPLYSFGRKQGLSSQDAEDATQEFLAAVINGKLLEHADPAKGRFRAYLLTAWKRFLINQYRKNNAERRGGRQKVMSLDITQGERSWDILKSKEPDPDRVFMASWAESLLEEARLRLRRDYEQSGKSEIAASLLPRLTHSLDAAGYQRLAHELDRSVGAVKVAMHRLRQKFGHVLREVVAETVESEADIDQELDDLLDVLTTRQA